MISVLNNNELDENVVTRHENPTNRIEMPNEVSTTYDTKVIVYRSARKETKRSVSLQLKKCLWSRLNSKTVITIGLPIFTCATTIIATLIVYFSAPTSIPTCQWKLTPTTPKSTVTDSHPRFAAVADFNNDTWLDFTIANCDADNIGVFLGYGNGSFQSQRVYSTGIGSAPHAVSVGDFNNDYRMDVVVANFGTNEIRLLLGSANGTLTHHTTISTGSSHPIHVAAADLNNDGLLDIVVVNFGTDSIDILLGSGNGQFNHTATLSTAYDSLPTFAAVEHLNDDENLDIVVVNRGTRNIGLFYGYGDGRFTEQTIFDTGSKSYPSSVAIAHFDNDTHLDIAVANSGTNNVLLLRGHGNGTFSIEHSYPTDSEFHPTSISTGDFNNDSLPDIVVANSGDDSVGVLFSNRNQMFDSWTRFSTASHFRSFFVVSGDFNSDNRSDILSVHSANNEVGVFIGYTEPIFLDQRSNDVEKPKAITVGDFNHDDRLDIAVVSGDMNSVLILLGNNDGTFTNGTTIDFSDGRVRLSPSLVAADFNNDGLSDIVVTNAFDNTVLVFLGNADGTFTSQPIVVTQCSDASSLAVGNFNNDSKLDITVGSSQSICILLGNGDGTFLEQFIVGTYSSFPMSLAVGDFNNDNNDDIVVTNFDSNTVSVFLREGNGTFQAPQNYPTGYYAHPISVAVGDFDNDGRLDFAVVNQWNNNVLVFLGTSEDRFLNQNIYATGDGSNPSYVAVGDCNNDNRLDLFIAMPGFNQLGILLGYGDGSFASPIVYFTDDNSQPASITSADFNSDHQLDIAMSYPNSNNLGVFLGFVRPSFMKEVSQPTGSSPHPQSVLVSDLNNDTHLDIVTANYGTGNVVIQYGDGNGNFSKDVTYPINSLATPTSAAVADFNNDQLIDIAIANAAGDNIGIFYQNPNRTFGNYTTYPTGSNSQSQSVSSGDFNNDHRVDMIVANYQGGDINVLLRSDGGYFHSQVTYSTGDSSQPQDNVVGDFNNDGRLDIVVTHNSKSSIGIFLGNGDGTFSNQTSIPTSYPYPVLLAAGDLNADGHLDIVVAENAPNVIEIFLGNGNGTFKDGSPYSTNYNSFPDDVAVGDLNGDNRLDIIVALQSLSCIAIFVGYGDGSFTRRYECLTGESSGSTRIAVGDLNNDGRMDIVLVHQFAGHVGVLLGNGDGTFSNQIIYSTGDKSQLLSMAIADLNNDNRLDLVVAVYSTDSIDVLFGCGNGSFCDQSTYFMGKHSQPGAVAVSDVNNDGQLDIVVANSLTWNIAVLLGFVNGTFFNRTTFSTGDYSAPWFLSIADFNGDNRSDVVVSNVNGNTVGIFLGYAEETFLSAPLYSPIVSAGPTYVATHDLNHDSQLDVVIANNQTDTIVLFFGTGYGTFHNQTWYSTEKGSNPCWVALADLNNDSRPDIVVANKGNDNIGIFLANSDGTFSNQKTYRTGLASQPSSVVIGDFNNDTYLDIAAACYGTNIVNLFFGYGNGTFASRIIFASGFDAHPVALATGDVNEDHLTDIVITNNGYGNTDVLSKAC